MVMIINQTSHEIKLQSLIRPVIIDFMFYISPRIRFSPNSGNICTNFYFVIFLGVFQFSKFLMNMLLTFVLFYSFFNHFMGVNGTYWGLTNREFTLIVLARFQGKIAQTWDSDKKVCEIVLILLCNSLHLHIRLAWILDVKHEINFKRPYLYSFRPIIKYKYTMYPWSLQANLFMGGQCTFATDRSLLYSKSMAKVHWPNK